MLIMTPKQCYFCKKNIADIDYRDANQLRRYLSAWSKIKPGKKTGTCFKHQKKLTTAIKRARFLALIPYLTR